MTTFSAEPAPTDLADIVLGVDGVDDVYPPQSALARIPGIVASAVANAAAAKEIGTAVVDGRTTLTARIATVVDEPTPDTARRVADLLLASVPDGDVAVDIRIERIR